MLQELSLETPGGGCFLSSDGMRQSRAGFNRDLVIALHKYVTYVYLLLFKLCLQIILNKQLFSAVRHQIFSAVQGNVEIFLLVICHHLLYLKG